MRVALSKQEQIQYHMPYINKAYCNLPPTQHDASLGYFSFLVGAERYSVPFLEPAADAAAEGVNLNWWEPTSAPTRVLLNPEGSPPPMFPSVYGSSLISPLGVHAVASGFNSVLQLQPLASAQSAAHWFA